MPQTIMIVEDNDLVRESLVVWLTIAFPYCQFEQAGSGEQAVSLAQANPIDLVLMDLGLTKMNGIEATRTIKARHPQIQVVLLSIQEDAQYVADALQAGAIAYVCKRKMHAELIPLLAGLLSIPLPEPDPSVGQSR
ncbi:MAG: response regulator transcription factor [Chloroflexi bacterium]|nr:response regulator transcription factor [Chloroflexota bacterium]